jgi:glycosyltransferase involved in cell wall biosynthesis
LALAQRVSKISAETDVFAKTRIRSAAQPEPFGLVMIEAMACGTPVIAFRRGSVPEVVDHGVTGFIVDDEQEGLQAINRLPELDRSRVRAGFERRFTARRMAEDYVRHYHLLLENRSSRPTVSEDMEGSTKAQRA